ncbi:MAG TPA: sulfurtransferase TusA family protein [Gammaproteobacteria bacterium]|nr:sulfurtransferase TusA family protein [Gammaproteobacteria bacterium]
MAFFGRKKQVHTAIEPVGSAVLSSGETVTVAASINCIGDSCPRPQLMTKKALSLAVPGDVIEILIDNPTSMEAVSTLIPELGATHLDTVKAARCWKVYARNN